MNIRATTDTDLSDLERVLDETGLFPSEMLADMVSGFLSNDVSHDIWLTCESEGEAVGFCYAVPEQLTEGTWNMLAIAVLPAVQGSGVGAALVAELESRLQALGQRILIADTSGAAEFERTRGFYRKNGYVEEARIREFWGEGDDKVVFWKNVTGSI
ncbi:MAG: GNAT family N-acetyltransferase [Woeseiaceae bacterium]|nr:GNAT family N-acetyltransferase [Woeseiaceae bacterium]